MYYRSNEHVLFNTLTWEWNIYCL